MMFGRCAGDDQVLDKWPYILYFNSRYSKSVSFDRILSFNAYVANPRSSTS